MVGIYKIESPSGHIYIGKSIDVYRRWYEHKKNSARQCYVLKRSFQKYGGDAHSFSMLHELPMDVDHTTLDAYEILYIQIYRAAGIELLNISNGGTGGPIRKGHINSVDHRNKIGAATKGRKIPIDVTLRIVATRKLNNPSYGAGRKSLNKTNGTVSFVNGRKVLSQEIIDQISRTKREGLNQEDIEKLKAKCKEMSINNIGKKGPLSKKSIKIEQYDLSGNLIAIHHGAREASRLTGVDRKSIYVSCNDETKTAGKFKWKYH